MEDNVLKDKYDEKGEPVHVYKTKFEPKKVKLKSNYKFYNNNIFFKILSSVIIFFAVIITYIMRYTLWGFKLTGKKNLKGIKGAVTISNHCLVQDAFLNVPTLWPKKTYVTMLQSNLGFGFASKFLRISGAVPIPEDPKLMINFLKETKVVLSKNKFVHIYPEAALIPYSDHIRKFMPGAFHISYAAKVPIIPICFTWHKPKGIYFWKKKPMIRQNILKPYYPDYSLPKKECISKTCQDLEKIMSEYFNSTSEYIKKD